MGKRYRLIITSLVMASLLIIFLILPENKNQIKTPHFTFLFSKTIDSANIIELSKVLEGSYSKIGSNLNTTPYENIEVNIYAKRWRYIKATGHWGASGNVEGITKLHFIEKDWSNTEVSRIAVHEFVHTVVLKLLIDREPKPLDAGKFDEKFSRLPVWLWEGVSVYEADQFYEPNTLKYFDDGKYPEIQELNNRSKGQKIYTCGYTIIEYILNEYGRGNLIKLIESYGDIKNVLKISEKQFSSDWHEFIKENYLE